MTDPDATVVLARPQATHPKGTRPAAARPGTSRRARHAAILAGGVLLLAGGGGAAWYLLQAAPEGPPPKPEAPAVAPSPAPAGPTARPAEPGPRLAAVEAILGHRARAPTVFRLAENPRIFVVDFPDLDQQGAMFNRAAALIEKIGVPRDHLLDDAALAAAIARSGDTPGTYYYGHNYRGRDLERFFALAERDGIALNAAERQLREEVQRFRRLVPTGEEYAVVSVPGLEARVDEAMRRAILRHEIGHGYFFTMPAFAAHVAEVWRNVLTESERTAFRSFLARDGYDPALEEVMMNETMAYLIFTPDPRFFVPAHAGLTDARAEELRAALRRGAPQ